jgi:hypothetical protein
MTILHDLRTKVAGLAPATLSLLLPLAVARGQELPPGHVLVDDMIVPAEWLHGDGHVNSLPWNTPPDANIIPYEFAPEVATADRTTLRDAMDHLQAFCGVRFAPRWPAAVDWIEFKNNPTPGGAAEVGRRGGRQRVWLYPGEDRGVAIHELMHAMSFLHEHQRSDRDTFVTVQWANIQNGAQHNFNLLSDTLVGAYDFDSIMHYFLSAFSNGGGPTLTLNVPYTGLIGHTSYVSNGDGAGLRSLHGAPPSPTITHSLPFSLPVNPASAQTLTLFGDNYFKAFASGSPTTTGTRVFANGVALATTVVGRTSLTVTVPTNLLAQPGSLAITVRNPQPGIADTVSTPLFVPVPAVASATSWYGPNANPGFGEVVAIGGDYDNNGTAEVLVANPGNGSSLAGTVYLMSPTTGAAIATIPDPTAFVGGSFGLSLADLGDVNGDNISDFAVGNPGHNLSQGRVLIYSGATRTALTPALATPAGALLFGWAMATLDDLTGDGVRELAVGAPGFGGQSNAVHIVNPATRTVLQTIAMPSSDSFGQAVAYLGDNTIAVGSPSEPNPSTTPNSGRFTLFRLTSATTNTMLYTRVGAFGQRLGSSLAAVGLVDNDLTVDVAVGASGINQVFVFSGVSGPSGPTTLASHANPGALSFGQRMTSVGDADGDGFGDIAANSTGGAGTVRVVSGKTGALIAELTLPAQPGGWRGGLSGGRAIFGGGAFELVTGAPNATSGTGLTGFVEIARTASASFRLTGCSLTAPAPTLVATTRPVLGTNCVFVTADQHPAGGSFIAVFGLANAPMVNLPLGACSMFLDPATLATVAFVVPAGGSTQTPVFVPNTSTLIGAAMAAQSAIFVGADIDTTNAQLLRIGL